MYSVELACSGADDLPWLDTLNFMWDSLPDADKVRTAADSAGASCATQQQEQDERVLLKC